MLNIAQFKSKLTRGELDTVQVVFPDPVGRLLGKRVTAHHFAKSVLAHGTHACNYLLTVDMEMEPVPGFKLANWESGYGDFALKPDLATLRLIPWQPAAAMVTCDLFHPGGALVEEAPRQVLRRQLARLSAGRLACFTASELEFFLFNHTYHEAVSRQFLDLTPSSDYRI